MEGKENNCFDLFESTKEEAELLIHFIKSSKECFFRSSLEEEDIN